MRDQATELRRIVQRTSRRDAPPQSEAPRLIGVVGAKPRAGATTVALNAALATAQHGFRALLVDADIDAPDVARLCGLDSEPGLGDVYIGRRDIHEVLLRGPAGLLVAPSNVRGLPDPPAEAAPRLIYQLQALARHAEVVFLDLGSGPPDWIGCLWRAIDEVLVTTSGDTLSVMDAYAAIKANQEAGAAVRVLVNRVDEAPQARDVFRRINASCRRFLGRRLEWCGFVPNDPQVRSAEQARQPLLIRHPLAPAALAIDEIAEAWQNRRTLRAA